MNSPEIITTALQKELDAVGIAPLKIVAPLCMGTSNQNFHVESGGEQWVLRINNPLTHRLCPRANEVACWRLAEAAGIAPELKFVSVDYNYYLSRYLGAERPWHIEYKNNSETVSLLSQLLDKVAHLPLPKHQVTPRHQWQFYRQEILTRQIQFNLALKQAAAELFALEESIEQILQRLEESQTLRFCHRDLNPHNLLLENNQLICIDFEYACSSDPRLELAALLAHHRLSNSQYSQLKSSQLTGSTQEKDQALRDANFLYWLFTASWALLMCDDGKGAQSWFDDAIEKIRHHQLLITV